MADLAVTQIILDVLTVSGEAGASALAGEGLVTQIVGEVLTVAGSITQTATIQHIVSGVSVVNVVGLASLVVSSEWIVSGGTPPFTYSWAWGDVENEAGFVSTAATSNTTRTYINAGGGNLGQRRSSSTVTDVGVPPQSATSAWHAHIAGVALPNIFDGIFQKESQPTRRVWPL